MRDAEDNIIREMISSSCVDVNIMGAGFPVVSICTDGCVKAVDAWVKTSDRLPPNDCEVMIVKYDGRPKVKMFFISLGHRMGKSWYESHDGQEIINPVTHWMSLPDLPKA